MSFEIYKINGTPCTILLNTDKEKLVQLLRLREKNVWIIVFDLSKLDFSPNSNYNRGILEIIGWD